MKNIHVFSPQYRFFGLLIPLIIILSPNTPCNLSLDSNNKTQRRFYPNKEIQNIFFLTLIIFVSSVSTRDIFIAPEHSICKAAGGFINRLYKTYPIGGICKLLNASQYNVKKLYYSSVLKNFQFHASKKDPLSDREIYVLIIGETSRYENWSINGYHRNTSPNLANNSEIISYSNVSISSTQTRTALPILFTRASVDKFDLIYREKSFLSAFKECDFKTYWISNQGRYSSPYVDEADKLIFLRSSIALETTYEGDMPPYLRKILDGNERKLLIVLHTLGSHHKYSHRYPDNFDLFKPSNKWKSTVRMVIQILPICLR
jgi:glucan phosphoethanolaminetransferase (alkaline phosphatase superfamily)